MGTPYRTNRRWVVCAFLRGRLVVELKLHYRTRGNVTMPITISPNSPAIAPIACA